MFKTIFHSGCSVPVDALVDHIIIRGITKNTRKTLASPVWKSVDYAVAYADQNVVVAHFKNLPVDISYAASSITADYVEYYILFYAAKQRYP